MSASSHSASHPSSSGSPPSRRPRGPVWFLIGGLFVVLVGTVLEPSGAQQPGLSQVAPPMIAHSGGTADSNGRMIAVTGIDTALTAGQDVDGATPGVQVSTTGGVFAVSVTTGNQAGTATVTAARCCCSTRRSKVSGKPAVPGPQSSFVQPAR